MKVFFKIREMLPTLRSVLFAGFSSILLALAFPGFEIWFLAWFGLVPLFAAINREKESFVRSFLVGWFSGTLFFFSTCWWLTFAPITYGGIPAILAYILLFFVTSVAGLFVGLFGGVFSLLLRRFGFWAVLLAPFLWTAFEFLRLWITGNNWNAVGYSQAFNGFVNYGAFGGVPFVSFCVVSASAICYGYIGLLGKEIDGRFSYLHPRELAITVGNAVFKGRGLSDLQENIFTNILMIAPVILFFAFIFVSIFTFDSRLQREPFSKSSSDSFVIAVQPNVPMEGLTSSKWLSLRGRQARNAEMAIGSPNLSYSARRQAEADALPENLDKRTRFYEELAMESFRNGKKLVIFPESPMNFQYAQDPEFREFVREFAFRNNVSVLFNSAEPDTRRKNGFFNSAVMVDESGEKVVQYDKIYLLPFGEFVPLPDFLAQFVPTMVGRFSAGEEYDLLPIGNTKAGVMICFESHFPSLSREYVSKGADVLIEMTNDGYLGNTPVLRQHLASAVFRAVETNRPVLRVTNVGITAYINERGEVLDEAAAYVEATRIWSVSKSDGAKTIYVKHGDWFAWLCLLVSVGLSFFGLWKSKKNGANVER